MLVFRVCRNIYAKDLSGNGARINGGRWNSPGVAAIYTSGSKSLAVLENLTNTPPAILQNDFSILTIGISGKISIDEITLKELPFNWNIYPVPVNVSKMGDQWLLSVKSLLLKVPSVIIPSEYNYVINPLHPDMSKLKIKKTEKLELDKRIAENL
jgi:RES domain-containing protein